MKLPHVLNKGNLINILIISLIISLTYYLSLKFVFPGYFEPLTPFNTDFYLLYSGSPLADYIDLYKWPRPIGVLLINLVSTLGLKLGIAFSITLTLINILLTILCIRLIRGNVSYLIIAIYVTNLFTAPYFYINHSWLILDTFAYLFFILIIILWYKYKTDFNINKMLLISFLIFLCFFTKETYIIAVVLFFIFQFIFEKKLRKYSLSLIIISAVFILVLVIHSYLINSMFVNFKNTSDSPYYINMNPKDIITTYLFYLWGIGNIYNVLIVILSMTILIFTKKYIKEVIMFIVLGLSIYIPYSLVPNHKLGFYCCLGSPLIYAVILFINTDVFSKVKTKIFNKISFNKKIAFSVVVIIFIALTFFNIDFIKNSYHTARIYLLEEPINRNILNSLEKVDQELSSSKDNNVLILGLKQIPHHPFKGAEFINNYFNTKHNNWTIALYNDLWIKANKEIRSRNGSIFRYIDIGEITPNDYNIVIIYNQNGELEKIIHNTE